MRRASGFTLIELMITVAIIGILTAIAYPSYTEYVMRSNRADAASILHETALFLERIYTDSNRYDQTSDGTAVSLPYTQAPRTGTAKHSITVVFGDAPAQSYTLTAAPVGSMSGDPCGSLVFTDSGATSVTGTKSVKACWGN